MKDRYTFDDLKDEEKLVKFLEKVWIAGARIGMIEHDKSISWLIENEYMPKFKEELNK